MKKKWKKLLLSLVIDGFGIIPLGPLDYIWAPISGLIIKQMYKNNYVAVFGAIEEALPQPVDYIPTATIMWIYENIIKK